MVRAGFQQAESVMRRVAGVRPVFGADFRPLRLVETGDLVGKLDLDQIISSHKDIAESSNVRAGQS